MGWKSMLASKSVFPVLGFSISHYWRGLWTQDYKAQTVRTGEREKAFLTFLHSTLTGDFCKEGAKD